MTAAKAITAVAGIGTTVAAGATMAITMALMVAMQNIKLHAAKTKKNIAAALLIATTAMHVFVITKIAAEGAICM